MSEFRALYVRFGACNGRCAGTYIGGAGWLRWEGSVSLCLLAAGLLGAVKAAAAAGAGAISKARERDHHRDERAHSSLSARTG